MEKPKNADLAAAGIGLCIGTLTEMFTDDEIMWMLEPERLKAMLPILRRSKELKSFSNAIEEITSGSN